MVVRKRAISLGITLAVIVGGIFLLQRFNVGGKLTDAAGGLGSFFPSLGQSFAQQFAVGASDFGNELKKIGENFQRSLGGGLLASEQTIFGGGGFPGGTVTEQTLTTQAGKIFPDFLSNAFAAFKPVEDAARRRVPESIFDVSKAFTPTAQTERITTVTTRPESFSSAFGGFGTSQAQESALQKAIAQTRQLFPQFFKV